MESREKKTVKRIGQKELARKLGVSQTAISGVLNNNPSIRVGKETRQRILDAIKESSYQPNLLANAVFDRPTKTVGIIYQGGYVQLGMRKLAAVVERVIQRGYLPLVYDLMLDMQGGQQCQLLCDMKVAGVIIINGGYPFMYDVFPKYLKGRVPVVSIDSPEDRDIPQVFTDRRQGFRILADHLLGKGYREIGVLMSRSPAVAEDSPYTPTFGLLHGVKESLSSAGLELAGVEYNTGGETVGFWSNPYRSGEVALAKLLDKGCRPEAIICSSDPWAIGAIRECRRRAIKVPEELAIVGFNDEVQAGYAACPLTTVSPPVDDLAETALELLIGPDESHSAHAGARTASSSRDAGRAGWQGEKPPAVVLPCHLVIRESCGRPGVKVVKVAKVAH